MKIQEPALACRMLKVAVGYGTSAAVVGGMGM